VAHEDTLNTTENLSISVNANAREKEVIYSDSTVPPTPGALGPDGWPRLITQVRENRLLLISGGDLYTSRSSACQGCR
jgi:hypothetical protein